MLASTPFYSCGLAPYPPVPSRSPVYKTTLTTTTNETTTTWTGAEIGTEHPLRIIILGIYGGVSAAITATVNDIPPFYSLRNGQSAVLAFQVVSGITATIVVSATASERKAVHVYVAYPHSHTPLDSASGSASTTNPVALTDVKTIAGGFAIVAGRANGGSTGAVSCTWSGNGTITEDYDSVMEATATPGAYRVHTITESGDSGDGSFTCTGSNTKNAVMVSWGPPPPVY